MNEIQANLTCPECGYNLCGLPHSDVVSCPECGQVSVMQELLFPQTRHRGWILVLGFLPGLLAPWLLLWVMTLAKTDLSFFTMITLPIAVMAAISIASTIAFMLSGRRNDVLGQILIGILLGMLLAGANVLIGFAQAFAMLAFGVTAWGTQC